MLSLWCRDTLKHFLQILRIQAGAFQPHEHMLMLQDQIPAVDMVKDMQRAATAVMGNPMSLMPLPTQGAKMKAVGRILIPTTMDGMMSFHKGLSKLPVSNEAPVMKVTPSLLLCQWGTKKIYMINWLLCFACQQDLSKEFSLSLHLLTLLKNMVPGPLLWNKPRIAMILQRRRLWFCRSTTITPKQTLVIKPPSGELWYYPMLPAEWMWLQQQMRSTTVKHWPTVGVWFGTAESYGRNKVLTISSVTVIWSVLLFLRLMRRCVSPRGSECRIPMMLVDLLDSRQTTAMRSTRSWHPEVQWLGFAAPALVMSPKGTVTCRTNSDHIHYHNVQQMPVRAGWALLQALRRTPALTRLIV